jgi:hypothetical protein
MIISNSRGLKFHLRVVDGSHIAVTTMGVTRIMSMGINDFIRRWDGWLTGGKHIQQAFDNLKADDREFLMTGITPEMWNEMFPPDEE